jgi:hypothetical protein
VVSLVERRSIAVDEELRDVRKQLDSEIEDCKIETKQKR